MSFSFACRLQSLFVNLQLVQQGLQIIAQVFNMGVQFANLRLSYLQVPGEIDAPVFKWHQSFSLCLGPQERARNR